jgi:nucleotide-binding universal stress UspA family protein
LSQIIEGAGRPVLIVPEHAPDDPAMKRAVIGWDGSREASRAVFDAIPVLKCFDDVEIVSVNVDPADKDARNISVARLADSLAKHGIDASFRILAGSGSDSKALVEIGKGSDLMVLGAYHHNRIRELFFGGVTIGFLKTLPCPVLFSR